MGNSNFCEKFYCELAKKLFNFDNELYRNTCLNSKQSCNSKQFSINLPENSKGEHFLYVLF